MELDQMLFSGLEHKAENLAPTEPFYLTLFKVLTLAVSPSLVSRYCEGYSVWVFEDLNFKISEGYKLQFWSELSEILNFRSSNTPEPIAFTIP